MSAGSATAEKQQRRQRRNTRVGRLKHGGWELELDFIGYNPHTSDLVYYESSVDAHKWDTREARYVKKFEAARKHIFAEVISWLSPKIPLRQIAVFPSHPKGRETIAGGQIVSIDEFVAKVRSKVVECGVAAAVPYPKTTRFCACYSFPAVAITALSNIPLQWDAPPASRLSATKLQRWAPQLLALAH